MSNKYLSTKEVFVRKVINICAVSIMPFLVGFFLGGMISSSDGNSNKSSTYSYNYNSSSSSGRNYGGYSQDYWDAARDAWNKNT